MSSRGGAMLRSLAGSSASRGWLSKGASANSSVLPATSSSSSSSRSPSFSVPRRGIAGRVMREYLPKLKPFPYETRQFNLFWALFDRTTLRFDENTKLVVVDGAHAVGKTKFAQELAEELDMKFMPQANMDFFYVSPYGVDIRQYNDLLMPRNKTYDEKDFARDPLGPVEGSTDRLLIRQYMAMFHQHVMALRHIFNTGQGVILEKSIFSHYTEVEAAYDAGWIDRETKIFYYKMRQQTLEFLLRPNLIVYLDAPVDVVQKRIAARGHEWEQNSPVFGNTQHLNNLYNKMKRDYLQEAKITSEVLVYDWSDSTEAEVEVVIEDVEKINFDYLPQYELQQKDWRFMEDEEAMAKRLIYSRKNDYYGMMNLLSGINYFDCKHLWKTADETENMNDLLYWLKGTKYDYGYNADMGDKNVLFRTSNYLASTKPWYTPAEPKAPWNHATLEDRGSAAAASA